MVRLSFLAALGAMFLTAGACRAAPPAADSPATAVEDATHVTLSNGLLRISEVKRSGMIDSIRFLHAGHPLELTDGRDGMYFDANGGPKESPSNPPYPRPKADYAHPVDGAVCRILQQGPETAELELEGKPQPWFPFESEVHYVLPRGRSGFYAYALLRHGPGLPAAALAQTRFTIKGVKGSGLYTNHVVDEQRKGRFPVAAVLEQVQDATYRLADGTIYTKYDNSAFTCDYLAHGMVGNGVGLWVLWPATESLNGGPLRQDLTVHEENVLLAMFQSAHFGAGSIELKADEKWSKFLGPVFIYANEGASVDDMFADARRRAHEEQAMAPYRWLRNPDYPIERGSVSGRIVLTDGRSVKDAWVILAPPDNRDWALSAAGYMFWTKADASGRFTIPKVRTGSYVLWVSGANQFEDFRQENVEVKAGASTNLGDVLWRPVTHGRTLWQIGIADRSSREFKNGDDVRHYGNFLRYPSEFPDDVTFTIGKSREKEDWNFAQWGWYSRRPYWTIRFELPSPVPAKATLTLGLASAETSGLRVMMNGRELSVLNPPKSGAAGYRSGGQDSRYAVFILPVEGSQLKACLNEVTLGHVRTVPFTADPATKARASGEVMYDAIRFEAEP